MGELAPRKGITDTLINLFSKAKNWKQLNLERSFYPAFCMTGTYSNISDCPFVGHPQNFCTPGQHMVKKEMGDGERGLYHQF